MVVALSAADYPTLVSWLGPTPPSSHPLYGLRAEILRPLEGIARRLSVAGPRGLPEKIVHFRGLSDIDPLLQMRAELLIGACLARAQVPFGLGAPGEADYVLQADSDHELGIEVTTRILDGPWRLQEDLETLVPAGVQVTLAFNDRRLKVTSTQAAEATRVLTGLLDVGGSGQVTSIGLTIRVDPHGYPPAGDAGRSVHLVFNDGLGSDIGRHMAAIERELGKVVRGKAHTDQADGQPTALLVDIGRIGLASIHAGARWIPTLEILAQADWHDFAAVGVFTSHLHTDAAINVAVVHRDADVDVFPLVDVLSNALDLSVV